DSYHPPHPTYETYSSDSCGNDSHFGTDCPPWFPLNYEPEPVTPDFSITDSLIMENQHLDTIPKTESDEFIKSSVENLVPIPTNCDPEENIHLVERLLYNNSSPRPPEEFVFENSNDDIESFSSYPIPVEDSDSRMEEIDLSFNPDDPMPPGIKEDDDESERDILLLEELPSNYSLSLLVNESFYFDIPLFSRPPAKPPDVVQYSWKFEDSCQRILSSKSSFPQLKLGIMYPNLIN
nr:hypothetical protein [Tanacetum cinerariifolium]